MNSITQLVEVMNTAFDQNLKFEMPVNGTSMLPFIHAGDLVMLDKISNHKIKKGDVVLYKRENGQYVLHRIHSIKNKKLVMLGDNQLKLEKNIAYNQLLAKMISYKTKKKDVSVKSFKYRFWSNIWNIYLIRYVILKVKWLLLKLKKK